MQRVTYSDPHVSRIQLDKQKLKSGDSLTMAAEADCVLVATDHTQFDYPGILERAKLIVDARSAFKNHPSDRIVRPLKSLVADHGRLAGSTLPSAV